MFSSSSEDEATPLTPFNAITAHAKAVRARSARQKVAALPDEEAPVEQPRAAAKPPERKSRYIASLVKAVNARREELQRVAERKLVEEAKEREEERFVTPAYRRVLEERKRGERGEREGGMEGGMEGGVEGGVEEYEGDVEDGAGDGEKGVDAEEEKGVEAVNEGRVVNEGGVVKDVEVVREVVKEKKKRGMRRNDEKAIEAYRQRYFERRARRLAEKGGRSG